MATTRIDRIDRRTRPWRARYIGADGHRYSRTFARKADAEVWLSAQLAARDRGEGFDPNAGKVALGEWWEEFVDSMPPDRAPATVARYESLWRTHIAPSFATSRLNHITVAAVQRWLNDIERHWSKAATSTPTCSLPPRRPDPLQRVPQGGMEPSAPSAPRRQA